MSSIATLGSSLAIAAISRGTSSRKCPPRPKKRGTTRRQVLEVRELDIETRGDSAEAVDHAREGLAPAGVPGPVGQDDDRQARQVGGHKEAAECDL